MELVEDHERDAVEGGVSLQASGEDAVGDDLDPGCSRNPAFVTRRDADRLSDGLAEEGRHPHGRGAGCNPTRFEQEHATAIHPRLPQQAEGHDRRLACTRLRLEDRNPSLGECLTKVVDDLFDRQAGCSWVGEGGHRQGYGSDVCTDADRPDGAPGWSWLE